MAAATRYWFVLTLRPDDTLELLSSSPPVDASGTGATSLGYALGDAVAIPNEVSPFTAKPTFLVQGRASR